VNRRIAIVAATQKEIQPFLTYLEKGAEKHAFQSFQLHQLQIDILYTGIGIMGTMYALMDYLSHRHPDGWIQAGIGGAYDPSLPITGVYRISNEVVVGFGAQEKDGHIIDPFRLNWMAPDTYPFSDGKLICPFHPNTPLPEASGMTSFYSHGAASSISLLQQEKTGQIESMEGAAFFYVSLMKKIPFLEFRSISNMVAPRDITSWRIQEAITTLNEALIAVLDASEFNVDRLFNPVHI
jgi:futalosine hydrolase